MYSSTLIVAVLLHLIDGQNVGVSIPPGYEEVTKRTNDSIGAIDKCGQGATENTHKCVPYYRCDPKTKTIVEEDIHNRIGILDIRFGVNYCQHYLDVCCKIPDTPAPVPTPTPSPLPPQNMCGIRNVNGTDFKLSPVAKGFAEYGEFPWMVAILNKNYIPKVDKSLAICGGSLIADNVVLTGAHCVYKFTTDAIKVRAGEWDTQTEKERLPYQERDVAQIVLHPNFNNFTLFNDFALLILTNPVSFDQHVRTICLPVQDQILGSSQCFATGWGKDTFGREGEYQVILKKIELFTVDHNECQTALRRTRLGKFFELDESFMCAGGQPSRDTCTGDGGSPLVCPDPTNPGRYVQAGIVAWGIGCGDDGVPGVYADVTKFRLWIDQELRRLNIDSSAYII